MGNNNIINLKVHDIIKTEYAVAPEDGDILFQEIIRAFSQGKNMIILNFEAITRATTLFFNHATAPLLKEFSLEVISNRIKFENVTKSTMLLYLKVMTLADLKFNCPEEYKKTLEEELKIE